MDVLRTPDERFAKLEGYDFAPHYFTVTDEDGTPVRIHYVDEGPADAKPILLMHGNPTWAYLYRKMIRPLAAAGHRVIAVDLVGCGRSDKPARKADYTLARHYDWMSKWLTGMDLSGITLFCQDWGGTIGLYLTAKHPERFDRAIASNTGLPTGDGESEFMKMWVGDDAGRDDVSARPTTAGGQWCTSRRPGELAAYNAPFPSRRLHGGDHFLSAADRRATGQSGRAD